MSYDLMVFNPEIAPRTRSAFINWYSSQTSWSEEHSYDDPIVSSDQLKSWFAEMINTYPAMNGPHATEEDDDNEYITDYSIGKEVIYAAFSWSVAEQAYEKMKALAEKHRLGFFDASADNGDILFPDSEGENRPIDYPENLSSIQQIKRSVLPRQEDMSVQDIIYNKVLLLMQDKSDADKETKPKSRSGWWQRIFGRK